jgi:hypothetical protein
VGGSADTDLTGERYLTAGSGIALTDAGAGGNITAALNVNGLSAKTTISDDYFPMYAPDTVTYKVRAEDLYGGASALSAAPANNDRLPLYDTSAAAGSKARSITIEELFRGANNLTEDTAPDGAADFLISYDASAAQAKKILVNKVRPFQTFVFQINSELTQSGTIIGTTFSARQHMFFPYDFVITGVHQSFSFNSSSFTLQSDVRIGCTEAANATGGVQGGTSCMSSTCATTSGGISGAGSVNSALAAVSSGQVVGIFCASSSSIATTTSTVLGWKVYVTGYRTGT